MSDNIQSDQTALFGIIDSMDINPAVDTSFDEVPTPASMTANTVATVVPNADGVTAVIPTEDAGATTTVFDTADIAADHADDVNMEEYMARFEKIQSQNEVNKRLLAAIMSSPHDQARVKALIEYVVHSQSQTEEIYNLLVDMNNLFGK